jgi:phosphoglycolate phosphatase
MTNKPNAILFDWDNTLIDSWNVIHAAMNETLAAMQQPLWSRMDIEARVRGSARDSFPALFGNRAEDAQKIFFDAYERRHIAELRPIDGAEELLRELSESGFYLAVISNKRGPVLRLEARHLGWEKYFGALAGAGDAAKDKPAAEHVELALAGGPIRPGSHVWLVGDTDIDLVCAKGSGCVPVLIRAQAPQPGEFAEALPEHYFPDLEMLKAALLGG